MARGQKPIEEARAYIFPRTNQKKGKPPTTVYAANVRWAYDKRKYLGTHKTWDEANTACQNFMDTGEVPAKKPRATPRPAATRAPRKPAPRKSAPPPQIPSAPLPVMPAGRVSWQEIHRRVYDL